MIFWLMFLLIFSSQNICAGELHAVHQELHRSSTEPLPEKYRFNDQKIRRTVTINFAEYRNESDPVDGDRPAIVASASEGDLRKGSTMLLGVKIAATRLKKLKSRK